MNIPEERTGRRHRMEQSGHFLGFKFKVTFS